MENDGTEKHPLDKTIPPSVKPELRSLRKDDRGPAIEASHITGKPFLQPEASHIAGKPFLQPETPHFAGKPFLQPEALDIVDGIRPSSSKTRSLTLLPAIQESLYEDKEDVSLYESRSSSSVLSRRHHVTSRVSSKPALTSISEELLTRTPDSVFQRLLSRVEEDDEEEHGAARQTRSQGAETRKVLAQSFGDTATSARVELSLAQLDSPNDASSQFQTSLGGRSHFTTLAGGEGEVEREIVQKNETEMETDEYCTAPGHQVSIINDRCNSHPINLLLPDGSEEAEIFESSVSRGAIPGAGEQANLMTPGPDDLVCPRQDIRYSTSSEHRVDIDLQPSFLPSQSCSYSEASITTLEHGRDSEESCLELRELQLNEETVGRPLDWGCQNDGEMTSGQDVWTEAFNGETVGRPLDWGCQNDGELTSGQDVWTEAYLNGGDTGTENLFFTIGEEQVIPMGDVLTSTRPTLTTEAGVFKPVACIASLNIYINQIVLGSLCEVIVQLALNKAMQDIEKDAPQSARPAETTVCEDSTAKPAPVSSRPKGSGSDSIVGEAAGSGADSSVPRESHSEHTTGSASSERQDKEFKDKDAKKQREKDTSSKQRGRERERNKRKRDREDRGSSAGKQQKLLRNAVGDVQRLDNVHVARDRTSTVSDVLKNTPTVSVGHQATVTEVTATFQNQPTVRESSRQSSEQTSRSDDAGDVRDHNVKSSCGLESQTVTSSTEDSSIGDSQANRTQRTESDETLNEEDKSVEEYTWNLENSKTTTSRFGKRTSLHRAKVNGVANSHTNVSCSTPTISEKTNSRLSSPDRDSVEFNDGLQQREETTTASLNESVDLEESVYELGNSVDLQNSPPHNSSHGDGAHVKRPGQLNPASLPVCQIFDESFNHPPKYSTENVSGDWDEGGESLNVSGQEPHPPTDEQARNVHEVSQMAEGQLNMQCCVGEEDSLSESIDDRSERLKDLLALAQGQGNMVISPVLAPQATISEHGPSSCEYVRCSEGKQLEASNLGQQHILYNSPQERAEDGSQHLLEKPIDNRLTAIDAACKHHPNDELFEPKVDQQPDDELEIEDVRQPNNELLEPKESQQLDDELSENEESQQPNDEFFDNEESRQPNDEFFDNEESRQPNDELLENEEIQQPNDEFFENEESRQPNDELLENEESQQPNDEFFENEDSQQPNDEFFENEESQQPNDEFFENEESQQPNDEFFENEESQEPNDEFFENEESQQPNDEFFENEEIQQPNDEFFENEESQQPNDEFFENEENQQSNDEFFENEESQQPNDEFFENEESQQPNDEFFENEERQQPNDEFFENEENQQSNDEFFENEESQQPNDEFFENEEIQQPNDEFFENEESQQPNDEFFENEESQEPNDEFFENEESQEPNDEFFENEESHQPNDEFFENEESQEPNDELLETEEVYHHLEAEDDPSRTFEAENTSTMSTYTQETTLVTVCSLRKEDTQDNCDDQLFNSAFTCETERGQDDQSKGDLEHVTQNISLSDKDNEMSDNIENTQADEMAEHLDIQAEKMSEHVHVEETEKDVDVQWENKVEDVGFRRTDVENVNLQQKGLVESMDVKVNETVENADLQPEEDVENVDLQPEETVENVDLQPEKDVENVDLQLKDAVENVDLQEAVENVDLQPEEDVENVDLQPEEDVENVDLQEAVENVDLQEAVENVDLQEAVENVDLQPEEDVENVDLQEAVENVDLQLQEAVENVDLQEAVENVDLQEAAENVDLQPEEAVENVDLQLKEAVENVDLQEAVENVDFQQGKEVEYIEENVDELEGRIFDPCLEIPSVEVGAAQGNIELEGLLDKQEIELRRYLDEQHEDQVGHIHKEDVKFTGHLDQQKVQLAGHRLKQEEELAGHLDEQEVDLAAQLDEQEVDLAAQLDEQEVDLAAQLDEQEVDLAAQLDEQEVDLAAQLDEKEVEQAGLLNEQREMLGVRSNEQDEEPAEHLDEQEDLAVQFDEQEVKVALAVHLEEQDEELAGYQDEQEEKLVGHYYEQDATLAGHFHEYDEDLAGHLDEQDEELAGHLHEQKVELDGHLDEQEIELAGHLKVLNKELAGHLSEQDEELAGYLDKQYEDLADHGDEQEAELDGHFDEKCYLHVQNDQLEETAENVLQIPSQHFDMKEEKVQHEKLEFTVSYEDHEITECVIEIRSHLDPTTISGVVEVDGGDTALHTHTESMAGCLQKKDTIDNGPETISSEIALQDVIEKNESDEMSIEQLQTEEARPCEHVIDEESEQCEDGFYQDRGSTVNETATKQGDNTDQIPDTDRPSQIPGAAHLDAGNLLSSSTRNIGEMDVLPVSSADMDVLPVSTTEMDVLPTTTAEVDVLPVTTAEMDVLPVSTTEMDVLPTTTAEVDVLPVTTAEMDVLPTTAAQMDVLPTTTAEVYVSPAATAEDDLLSQLHTSPELIDLSCTYNKDHQSDGFSKPQDNESPGNVHTIRDILTEMTAQIDLFVGSDQAKSETRRNDLLELNTLREEEETREVDETGRDQKKDSGEELKSSRQYILGNIQTMNQVGASLDNTKDALAKDMSPTFEEMKDVLAEEINPTVKNMKDMSPTVEEMEHILAEEINPNVEDMKEVLAEEINPNVEEMNDVITEDMNSALANTENLFAKKTSPASALDNIENVLVEEMEDPLVEEINVPVEEMEDVFAEVMNPIDLDDEHEPLLKQDLDEDTSSTVTLRDFVGSYHGLVTLTDASPSIVGLDHVAELETVDYTESVKTRGKVSEEIDNVEGTTGLEDEVRTEEVTAFNLVAEVNVRHEVLENSEDMNIVISHTTFQENPDLLVNVEEKGNGLDLTNEVSLGNEESVSNKLAEVKSDLAHETNKDSEFSFPTPCRDALSDNYNQGEVFLNSVERNLGQKYYAGPNDGRKQMLAKDALVGEADKGSGGQDESGQQVSHDGTAQQCLDIVDSEMTSDNAESFEQWSTQEPAAFEHAGWQEENTGVDVDQMKETKLQEEKIQEEKIQAPAASSTDGIMFLSAENVERSAFSRVQTASREKDADVTVVMPLPDETQSVNEADENSLLVDEKEAAPGDSSFVVKDKQELETNMEAVVCVASLPQYRDTSPFVGDGKDVELEEFGVCQEGVHVDDLDASEKLALAAAERDTTLEVSPAKHLQDVEEETKPLVKETKDGRRRVKKGAGPKASQNLTETDGAAKAVKKTPQKAKSADEGAPLKSSESRDVTEAVASAYGLRVTQSSPAPACGVKRLKIVDVKDFPKDQPCIYRPEEAASITAAAAAANKLKMSRTKPASGKKPVEPRYEKKGTLWKRLKSILKGPKPARRDGRFRFVKKYKQDLNSQTSVVVDGPSFRPATASDSMLQKGHSKHVQTTSSHLVVNQFSAGLGAGSNICTDHNNTWHKSTSPPKPLKHKTAPVKRNQWRRFRRLRVLRHSAEMMGSPLPPIMNQSVSSKNYIRMKDPLDQPWEEEAKSRKTSKDRRTKRNSLKRTQSPLLEHPKDAAASRRCELVNAATPEVFEVFCHEDEDVAVTKEIPTVRMLIKPRVLPTSDVSPETVEEPVEELAAVEQVKLAEVTNASKNQQKKQSSSKRWRCTVM
ncbi:uncharacterized protein LOC131951409 [Physella acuta]|uniref:uncharacterized protein LOC131951409 n=1 Tax=Physella acuta TaxID=109671 RepID=UPI0027DDF0C5|nr:uncharacterized protein LOC131951409 [Physella acuta]